MRSRRLDGEPGEFLPAQLDRHQPGREPRDRHHLDLPGRRAAAWLRLRWFRGHVGQLLFSYYLAAG